MEIEKLPDGTIMEIYANEEEYRIRKYELERTVGRRQIIYEGWLNGKLVRILMP